ncbi:MAG: hypothetical protein ACRC14_08260 [Paracoccaceae bacterium]
MFSILDETVPIALLRKYDAPLALAEHFHIRPLGWGEVDFGAAPGGDLSQIAHCLADRLAQQDDLRFVKLNVVFPSAESDEKVANFRKHTGLDADAILRRSVVGNGASVEDWVALFGFAIAFGWDAAAISRRKKAMVWFSHDDYLRATPPSLVRRFWN